MNGFRVKFLAILIVGVLGACNMFDPQWIGIWVDDSDENVTVELNFSKDEGTVTVDNTAPEARFALMIVKGPLDGDEDTMTATITYLYALQNDPPNPPIVIEEDNPTKIEWILATLGIGRTNSCSYSIDGDTMTVTGHLVEVLTSGKADTSDTLVAIRQP